MKVKACPICGTIVKYHCWHGGTEEPSVEMEAADVLKLLEHSRDEAIGKLVGFQNAIEDLRAEMELEQP